jgi:hypothetical protein
MGWYSRGYLPHFDCPEIYQSITYRLDDSLPRHVLEELQLELNEMGDLRTRILMSRNGSASSSTLMQDTALAV